MRIVFIAGFTLLFVMHNGCMRFANAQNRDQIMADIAKSAIQVSVLNAHSPSGRYACSVNNFACIGPNKAELGLMILESGHSDNHYLALIDLMAVKMDAGLSEDYSCALIYQRRAIRQRLTKAKPEILRATCLADVGKILARVESYSDLEPDQVCLSVEETANRIADYKDMLSRNATCEP